MDKQILSLLAPSPALGEPWPTIPGPELDDRVCIVGAGASGIHMAISLKKRNYENVSSKLPLVKFDISNLRLLFLRSQAELAERALI